MNLANAQLQNYKFTRKKPYPQHSGTKVGWEQPWKLCNHSVNFNFTSLKLEKHGITEGKIMRTLPEKLTAWHKFVTFNIYYNFHTKQAYLFHNWSIYYKMMLLLNLNAKLMTVTILVRSSLVSTQFSHHSNTSSPHCSQDVGTVRKKTYLTTKTEIYLECTIFLC